MKPRGFKTRRERGWSFQWSPEALNTDTKEVGAFNEAPSVHTQRKRFGLSMEPRWFKPQTRKKLELSMKPRGFKTGTKEVGAFNEAPRV